MKKQSIRWGCLLGILLMLFLAVGGGGLWLLRSSPPAFDAPLDSSIFVYITSPASEDEINAGDYLTVTAQVVAPDPIASIELFVDGKPFGSGNPPDSAAWTWQATSLGIHTFTARAANTKGETGNSQTVVVNVLAGNGVIQVTAEENQTLIDIGSGFGVPPDEMQKENPKLDPNAPLPDGQPVKIPIGQGEPGGGSAPGGDLGYIPFYITWQFIPLQPVDKSYCYTSKGDGVWEKLPKPPFNFFNDFEPYKQFGALKPGQNQVIQMQCWGWLGGVLKFLGQGETQFDAQKPPAEITIAGDGFKLTGLPKLPEGAVIPFTGGGGALPPPFAVREPSSVADCTAHGDPIVAGFLCPGIMNAKIKQSIILEWEWKPEACWPGFCKYGVGKIAGYGVYEIDPATQSKKFLADVHPSAMRVAFIPLPWGAKCYGVEAYVDQPGMGVSEMATYCPGTPPSAQKITLTPTQWLTTGGQWIQDGDCDDYGGADSYKLKNQNSGFGNLGGQVLVGSYIVDDDDCYREGDYSAGVKFDLSLSLPPNAVIQNAELRYSKIFIDYGATGVAAPQPQSCVKNIGKAKKDWSGLSAGIHFDNGISLNSSAYNTALTSVSDFFNQANVTQAVIDWQKNPANNYGFILAPTGAPHPSGDGSGECLSGLGNFQLDVYYFVP